MFKVLLLTNNKYVCIILCKDLPDYSCIGIFVWKTCTLLIIFSCVYLHLDVFSCVHLDNCSFSPSLFIVHSITDVPPFSPSLPPSTQPLPQLRLEIIFRFSVISFSCSCPASGFNNVGMMCNYARNVGLLFLLILKNNYKYFFLEHNNYITIHLGRVILRLLGVSCFPLNQIQTMYLERAGDCKVVQFQGGF